MKVLICGGGIGGLVTALGLREANIDCTVFEQSDMMGELGVGLNVLPHAIKALAGLGLLDRLDRVAIRTSELIYTNRFGQEIWREPRGRDAGYDVPQFAIHRGRLHGVLYQAVRERLGDAAVRTGHRLTSFEQDAEGVSATFVNRAGTPLGSARGDVLVGADGIHSMVRTTLFSDEAGPPRWNGVMMWRGATDWPPFLTGRSMIIGGGMRAKLVLYPIAEGATPGTLLTNWAVCVKTGDGTMPPPRRQDWARPGRVEALRPYLRLFSIPHVDLAGLVAATSEFYEFPMCDRDPLPSWTCARVTLLGDAAHPMYPVGSNGAGQAVLDAAALVRHLRQQPDATVALGAYQDERLPATAEIVRMNRAGGPEGVIDEVERRAPEGFDRIEDVATVDELEAIVAGYAKAAGFAREQVNRGVPR